MEESSYIFEQSETLFWIFLAISSIVALVGIYQLAKFFLKEDCYDSNGKKVNRLTIGIVVLLLSGLMFYGIIQNTNRDRRIKNNFAETRGRTLREYYQKGNYVDYEFVVGGKKYTNTCGCTYDGKDLPVDAPNGYYKVIYNSLDPTESIMDFKVKK